MNETYHAYTFENFSIDNLNYAFILKHSPGFAATDRKGFFDIIAEDINIDYALFTNLCFGIGSPSVIIEKKDTTLTLSCNCEAPKNKLCEHQIQVLFNIMDREDLHLYFNRDTRIEKMKLVAKDYGLENETQLDDVFQLEHINKSVLIKPKLKNLFAVNETTNNYLNENLLPSKNILLSRLEDDKENAKTILVLSQHKYYKQLQIELYQTQVTNYGKIKNPIGLINPTTAIWEIDNIEILKFYTAISLFQNNFTTDKSEGNFASLKAIVKNPFVFDCFYHDLEIGESINANSLVSIQLQILNIDIHLTVYQKKDFYEISGELIINDKPYNLSNLNIKYGYFIQVDKVFYLIPNNDLIRTVAFFSQKHDKIIIHSSKFKIFQQDILLKLENKVRISYSYLREATAKQLIDNNFDKPNQQIIYLSESGNFVTITPVMKYGDVEIPILSKKQIYATDENGEPFVVRRDDEAEIRFVSILLRQHNDFTDQLDREFLYLHKHRFLKEDWFFNVFEEWKDNNITIYGFNEIKNNKLNANKIKVSVSVASGINWFETSLNVNYGTQTVALKSLQKSIRNKSRFVQLGDGTLGILPNDWIEKFTRYFNTGDIVAENIRIPKINFSSIADLYEAADLTEAVKNELTIYALKVKDFKVIQQIDVPTTLHATLREYQKEGLNWLNFLDEFNFGGCLADDMGLGKTVQIIAFILSQKEKLNHPNSNLVVVPTSLIFNWQSEVEKFAPTLKILTIYGSDRIKNIKHFDQYDIVLTSYGTLLADINFIKKYHFNYVFLDESQAIKNPESQRYKSVRLLQSRNKIVMTGTPIENNTFDIYGQLSFACPGLLGNKQQFKDLYATPIDKFGDRKRAIELQKKISPFILRRTKKQVATELPEKTEMVIYCEMGAEQRRIYDNYAREIREYIASKKEENDLPKESMMVLKGITKLRQICNSPILLNDEAYFGNNSSKIEALIEQIENKSNQHKILVFSQFVSMLDLIKKELVKRNIGFQYLTGQTKNRAQKVNEFQDDDNVRVFLISLKAGGVGLNLTSADYVYLVDPWWNPAVENQAIDRMYRIGQQKNVVAVRLICPGTIEEKIMKMQQSKKELATDLIKTDLSILKSLSKKDLLELFR